MKSIYLAALAAVLGASAYASKCSDVDIPISFTISSSYIDPSNGLSYNSGILSDGLGTYVNGQPGVSALIHTCNGSNGATLNIASGTRYVMWDFRNAVYTISGLTPTWTLVNNGGFTIANLLYNYSPTSQPDFETYLKYARFVSPTGTSYTFSMEAPNLSAPFTAPDANVNSPCLTSPVHVHHIPATQSSNETWIVWPDSAPVNCTVSGSYAQVGTLRTPPPHGPTWVSAGQFTVPFYITIQRL